MDRRELLKAVAELGFPLFETGGYDVNKVLADVVFSHDVRLWEGFPVLLRKAHEQGKFDADQSLAHLDEQHRGYFQSLFLMSLALYKEFSLSLDFHLDAGAREDVQRWRDHFKEERLQVGDVALSTQRVRRLFEDYYLSSQAEQEKWKLVVQEEMTLEYAMSQLFSPRQKELFRKKLEGKPLTKTEREYFSRTVKKKVAALANDELHRLAKLLK